MENEFLSKCWGALQDGWELGCSDSCALTWFSRPLQVSLILSSSKMDVNFFGYVCCSHGPWQITMGRFFFAGEVQGQFDDIC
jgi:hypothetical protein